jgi:hypothetical protein
MAVRLRSDGMRLARPAWRKVKGEVGYNVENDEDQP